MRYLESASFFNAGFRAQSISGVMPALRLGAGILASLALFACSADVGDASDLEDVGASAEELGHLPTLPDPSLAVPDGNRLAFAFDATGVQIYACTASGTAYSWVFQAPEATLYNHGGHAVGTHYVGPTWEYKDESKVMAAKVAAFTADPTAIPELLLQATTHEGTGRMTPVTYIQRLDTTGGLAPSAGCDVDHVGAVARVDYTATYYFYVAKKACK